MAIDARPTARGGSSRSIVDVGELEPGTYRILSPGSDTPPVEITID